MSTIITVENLGKKYLLRHQSGGQPYVALRDVLSDGARNLGRKLLGRGNASARSAENEEFWALRDVSFEVRHGDRIGIIGRNGAGKSTLLKILSRITEPTTGSVRIKGRVASLLEVGTGFHPELTGRENIFLNGAILGMGRAEIKKKFDEIVDFAEIERFLDTPVKRYSSGMYVRLAFAVAAHLEPEILVVDEVLAVGDAQFQKKCLGKMEDVSNREGRTVLFVSHNMGAMNNLCGKGILLEQGKLVCFGEIKTVIDKYSSVTSCVDNTDGLANYNLGDKAAILLSVDVVDEEIRTIEYIDVTDKIGIRFKFKVLEAGWNPQPCFLLSTEDGFKIFQSNNIGDFKKPGDYNVVAWLPGNLLNDMNYAITCALTTPNPTYIHASTEINIKVIDNMDAHTRGDYKGQMHGVLRPLLYWEKI